MKILNGKLVDDNGMPVSLRFGDSAQSAFLRRLECCADLPLLEIETGSTRLYCASCVWTCPECGITRRIETDTDHESEDDAIDELLNYPSRWECRGCKTQFIVIGDGTERRLARPDSKMPPGFRTLFEL